jgi:hypothetical protein
MIHLSALTMPCAGGFSLDSSHIICGAEKLWNKIIQKFIFLLPIPISHILHYPLLNRANLPLISDGEVLSSAPTYAGLTSWC